MDLPLNFPPSTRFWQLTLEAVADLTTGDFMLLDGSIVSEVRADRLRQQVVRDGVEISEREFRALAPPSLAERLLSIQERAQRDPAFAKALGAALTDEDFKESERVAWDIFRNAPDPNDRAEAARLLMKISAMKQRISDQ